MTNQTIYSNDPSIKQAQIDKDIQDINDEIQFLEGFLAIQNKAKETYESYSNNFSGSTNFTGLLRDITTTVGTDYAFKLAFGEESLYASQTSRLYWLKNQRYQLMENLRPTDKEIQRYNYFQQHHQLLDGQVAELKLNIDSVRNVLEAISLARDALQPHLNAEWLDQGFFYELVALQSYSQDLISQLNQFQASYEAESLDSSSSLETRKDFINQWTSANKSAIDQFAALYDEVF